MALSTSYTHPDTHSPTIILQDTTNRFVTDAEKATWNSNTAVPLPMKAAVLVATTANITLSAPQTIDGVALVAGDRVLVKDQTLPATNGIYVVAAGTWTRALDANSTAGLASALVAVTAGTLNGGKLFDTDLKSTDGTIGTPSITWNKVLDEAYLLASTSTSIGTVKYNGITALAGGFDGGTTTPTGSLRLNYGGYFYPTFINLTASGDTTTTATHYYVETASDGFVRPKALANVKAEIVTTAAVNSAAATITGTVTSGSWASSIAAVTDTNDGTLSNQKFGRSSSQYIALHGSSGGNIITSYSTDTNPKEFNIYVRSDTSASTYSFYRDGTFIVPKVNLTGTTDYISSTSSTDSWAFSSSFSTSAQDSEPRDLHFSTDGTKMYIIGNAGNAIYQYTLSTPWSVATAVYLQQYVVTAEEAGPLGLYFSPNGLNMYICGGTVDALYRYTLTTAWDITTATYASTFSVTAQETDPNALWFSTDGLNLYVIGTTGDDVNQYTLTAAWDITTAIYSKVFSIAAYETAPQGLSFNDSGTKMWVLGSSYSKIVEYTLSVAWDIATSVFVDYVSVFNLSIYELTGISGVYVNANIGKAYVTDYTTDRVFELNTSTPIAKFFGSKFVVDPDLHLKNDLFVNRNLRTIGNISSIGTATVGAVVSSTYNGSSSGSSASVIANVSTGSLSIYTVQTSGVLVLGGTAATGSLTFGRSTAAQVINIGTGATATATTKTINIGTAGASGSDTVINLGSAVSGATSEVRVLGGLTEKVFTIPSILAPTLDSTNGNVQTWVLATGTSVPIDALTSGQSIILVITPGGNAITWPSVVWTKQGGSGALPTLFSAGKTMVVLWKVGAVLYGSHLGDTA